MAAESTLSGAHHSARRCTRREHPPRVMRGLWWVRCERRVRHHGVPRARRGFSRDRLGPGVVVRQSSGGAGGHLGIDAGFVPIHLSVPSLWPNVKGAGTTRARRSYSAGEVAGAALRPSPNHKTQKIVVRKQRAADTVDAVTESRCRRALNEKALAAPQLSLYAWLISRACLQREWEQWRPTPRHCCSRSHARRDPCRNSRGSRERTGRKNAGHGGQRFQNEQLLHFPLSPCLGGCELN